MFNLSCCLSPMIVFIYFHSISIYHLVTWEIPFLFLFFCLFSHTIPSLCIIKFNYHNLKDYHSSIIIITHYIFAFEVKLVDWDIHNSTLLSNKARLYSFCSIFLVVFPLSLYLFFSFNHYFSVSNMIDSFFIFIFLFIFTYHT